SHRVRAPGCGWRAPPNRPGWRPRARPAPRPRAPRRPSPPSWTDHASLEAHPAALVHDHPARSSPRDERDRAVLGRSERSEDDPAAGGEAREENAAGQGGELARAVRVARLVVPAGRVEARLDRRPARERAPTGQAKAGGERACRGSEA